jgi:glycosyltransferase involved in cell wall biosynthesis
MGNAAIYLNPEAYDTGGSALMGRHSAGESFLRGYIRHAKAERFHFWNVAGSKLETMNAFIQKVQPTDKPITWLGRGDRGGIREPGVAYIPTPYIAKQATWRLPFGQTAFGLCGVTHTTASHDVMDMIGNMLIAPVEPWDALICTSAAVRAATETQLEATAEYLERRLGVTRPNKPLIETISLGINAEEFSFSAENRKRWRAELEIPADAIVVLYVGRFNVQAKMNPLPMALAMELAAKQIDKPLYWVTSGWAKDDQYAEQFHKDSREVCPSVHYRTVDGRRPDVRFSIWSVADLFLSLSDNVQETFGLTPLEAMAARLPCVVSDWDGYRETVRDGVDGFRIPTYAPRPGLGKDLSFRHSQNWDSYNAYVGGASQFVAVDVEAAGAAIARLANDPDLRRRMGDAAHAYANGDLDWKALIPRYEALWEEQNARRTAAMAGPAPYAPAEDPWRLDPFRHFANYPTQAQSAKMRYSMSPDMTRAEIMNRLNRPVSNHSKPFLPSSAETDAIFVALSDDRQPATALELLEGFPPARRLFLERALMWLAKYGIVRIHPASS